MYRSRFFRSLVAIVVLTAGSNLFAFDPPAERRHRQALAFHHRAQERTGLLVPMYIYPADIHKNSAYNRLIDLKRRYETVPIWVILNPASGPGEKVDANYRKAIDRLCGAGCVVLGYVTTSYGRRREDDVRADIDRWLTLYPRIHGTFFDEMTYEDTESGVKYQASLNQYAHDVGCWPTVANPGAGTPGRYFAEEGADVIVVHEGDSWPKEDQLKGDYFGGYADYPPFTRGVLLHSQPKLDRASVRMVRQYARWLYVTDAEYRLGDPKAANPWAGLSKHLEPLCSQLAENEKPHGHGQHGYQRRAEAERWAGHLRVSRWCLRMVRLFGRPKEQANNTLDHMNQWHRRHEPEADRQHQDLRRSQAELKTAGHARHCTGGGRQWNLSDSYYGTQAHRWMKEVLARGGVNGGSSAGASIQAARPPGGDKHDARERLLL